MTFNHCVDNSFDFLFEASGKIRKLVIQLRANSVPNLFEFISILTCRCIALIAWRGAGAFLSFLGHTEQKAKKILAKLVVGRKHNNSMRAEVLGEQVT